MIYIIDDNRMHADLLKEFLQSTYENYIVKAFYHPYELLNRVFIERPKLIILDNGMPGKDGIALIEEINLVYRPKTIMISGLPYLAVSDLVDEYFLKGSLNYNILKSVIDSLICDFEDNSHLSLEEKTELYIRKMNVNYFDKILLKKIIMNYEVIKK